VKGSMTPDKPVTWKWFHDERELASGRWSPGIRLFTEGGEGSETLELRLDHVLCDTQEQARERNRRLADSFARRRGVPLPRAHNEPESG
jgi:hypothetical protein